MPKPIAAEEILKAQVGTQGIEAGIHFEESHHPAMVVVDFFKPREGFVFFAEADANVRTLRGLAEYRVLQLRRAPILGW